MKRLCVAALFALFCPIANAQVETKFDRFKGRTEISATKGVNLGGLQLVWVAAYEGEKLTSRPQATFSILASGKSWQYLRCHEVNFLADGKPVKVGETKHHGQVQRGYVIEMTSTPIPAESVDRLVAAAKVEMRICSTEYTFDDQDLANVRAFAAAVTP